MGVRLFFVSLSFMIASSYAYVFSFEELVDTNIHQMETMRFEEMEDKELRNESARDEEIQKIRNALDKASREMKGIALGLCQWKDEYLCHQGKISVPNNERIRVNLIQ